MCPTPKKARYATAVVARRELLRVLSRESAWARPAVPTRVYLCPCGAWHMTHSGRDADTPRDAVHARTMAHGMA